MALQSLLSRWSVVAAVLGMALALGGCAHPVGLSPDTGSLLRSAGTARKDDRKVALAITEEQRKREVTTPGGGGDKVSYFPYRDLETGLYVALSERFASVSRVTGATDPKVGEEGISLVVVPEITTNSYSPSLVTWPPTVFTITLECTVKDPSDKNLSQFRVQGEGRAEFDEFKSDPSLSAKRAAQDVLKKLITALGEQASKLR
jgi:hypothetical protein